MTRSDFKPHPLAGARWRALACAGAVALAPVCAQAALGGDAASVAADQSAWGAGLAVATAPGYTDYALQLPRGLVVHEFVNAAGLVFEVTWSGKGHRPDMARLLGAWQGRMVAMAGGARATARRADLVASDLVIHSALHSRWFSGTAHLPAQLPASLAGPLAVPAR
jgi:hypothetical protein